MILRNRFVMAGIVLAAILVCHSFVSARASLPGAAILLKEEHFGWFGPPVSTRTLMRTKLLVSADGLVEEVSVFGSAVDGVISTEEESRPVLRLETSEISKIQKSLQALSRAKRGHVLQDGSAICDAGTRESVAFIDGKEFSFAGTEDCRGRWFADPQNHDVRALQRLLEALRETASSLAVLTAPH